MPTDPTRYHPIEPTVPAFDPYAPSSVLSNPYEVTEPYHSGLPLVPPPPKQRHTSLIILWLVAVLLGSTIGTGALLSLFAHMPLIRAPSPTPVHQPTKPMLVTLTPTMTHFTDETKPTPQPTIDPNYTAVDIVNVYDNAGVLNTSQVQSAASQLNYPIDIYTTNKFTGTKANFGQEPMVRYVAVL